MEATGLFTYVPSCNVHSNREGGIITPILEIRTLRLRRVYLLGICQLRVTEKPAQSGLNDKDIHRTKSPMF